MKRFTETEKWRDSWFASLTAREKLAYIYMVDNCDAAGVWDANTKLADFMICEKVKWAELFKKMGNRVALLTDGKWLLTRFVTFQYGKLSDDCRPHWPVFRLIEKHRHAGYPDDLDSLSNRVSDRASDTLKDKNKNKDKDQDKKTEQTPPPADPAKTEPPQPPILAADIYAAYPRKEARGDAIRAIEKAMASVAPDRLLEATKAYATATASWPADERQFIPHPATWFNRGSYHDDRATWTRSKPAGAPVQQPMRMLNC
jgi:hypothetical protein